ncbi:MAG TPA: DNA polymerase/3'-5' exonuclease PolX [bacterium]|mgnify:CR=1 FL=1|nr:DNA polymerase/3'-5' exonuclease PolX [bacterium]
MLKNPELVHILKQMLAAMEVKDYNKFRIRAYQNAIASIESLSTSVYTLWQQGRLSEIPGVGGGLTQVFKELFTTGEVLEFNRLKADLPAGMFALIGIRGIGSKKAFKLASAFALDDESTAVEEIKKIAEAGKIRDLPGFGERSEAELLAVITEMKLHKKEKERSLFVVAEQVAKRLEYYLRLCPEVSALEFLGSYRRREATVGDLDIAIVTAKPDEVFDHFEKYEEIEDVLVKGEKKMSVNLTNNMQIDIRTVSHEELGSMMQYFTGSKAHNIVLRTHALEQDKSLSEYGIKHGKSLKTFSREEDLYSYLGLSYIEPELRQGKDEVVLAQKKALPELVNLEDIKGELHVHTNFSDGANTLEEMVHAADALGYEYFGVADHAPSVSNRGLKEVMNITNTHIKSVEHINSSTNLKVLLGYEVNILANGSISLPDESLSKLNFAIGSIHTAFDQDRDTITQRLINAIEHPLINIIGHPSGRLLNERPACDVNWTAVFKSAIEHDKVIEINAQPNRLDLADDLVREACAMGVKIMINTDAHSTAGLNFMRYGVYVARRGWCSKEKILNTLPLKEFLRELNIRNI